MSGLLAAVLILAAVSSSAHDRWWPHRHVPCSDEPDILSPFCSDDESDEDDADDEEYEGDNPAREAAKPRVESVTITSTPVRGATYGLGERIRVRARFDKTVTVSGSPTLRLAGGAYLNRDPVLIRKHYAAAHDTTVRTDRPDREVFFSYRVQAADFDRDGISIANNAITGGSITGTYTYTLPSETDDRSGGSLGLGPVAGKSTELPPPMPPVVRPEEDSEAGQDTARQAEPVVQRALPAPRQTVTEQVAAYTNLGSHAIANDANHKVDGSKQRVPTFGSASAARSASTAVPRSAGRSRSPRAAMADSPTPSNRPARPTRRPR